MDDNRLISYPLLSNKSARKIAIFKSELTKNNSLILWHEIEAEKQSFYGNRSIPRHYEIHIK